MFREKIWRKLLALEERVEALEERETDGEAAGRRLQEGIDNIMSYQWPPTKEADQ